MIFTKEKITLLHDNVYFYIAIHIFQKFCWSKFSFLYNPDHFIEQLFI